MIKWQQKFLLSNKVLHKIVFDKTSCPVKDDSNFQLWLKFGGLKLRMEGVLTLTHDINFYKKKDFWLLLIFYNN